ncbi:MAG: hypothetical protein ACJA0G_002544, partial [Kangiellaceae bacterium]
KHNKLGIELYGQGSYASAYEEFCHAKKISPLNIGIALNLMQSLAKLIKQTDKPEGKYIIEARELFDFINNMPLKSVHKNKFKKVRPDVEDIIS